MPEYPSTHQQSLKTSSQVRSGCFCLFDALLILLTLHTITHWRHPCQTTNVITATKLILLRLRKECKSFFIHLLRFVVLLSILEYLLSTFSDLLSTLEYLLSNSSNLLSTLSILLSTFHFTINKRGPIQHWPLSLNPYLFSLI